MDVLAYVPAFYRHGNEMLSCAWNVWHSDVFPPACDANTHECPLLGWILFRRPLHRALKKLQSTSLFGLLDWENNVMTKSGCCAKVFLPINKRFCSGRFFAPDIGGLSQVCTEPHDYPVKKLHTSHSGPQHCRLLGSPFSPFCFPSFVGYRYNLKMKLWMPLKGGPPANSVGQPSWRRS